MGYSLAWLAVKGKAPETIRQELGLRGTGRYEPFPESDLTAAALPNGWYLIVADDVQVAPDSALQDLTSKCEAVACFVEEHVMYSTAAGWRDGERIWVVTHESDHGKDHLEIEGELPPIYGVIREQRFAMQRAGNETREPVDHIFDIPVALAEFLTGFRHDGECPNLGDRGFEVLQSAHDNSAKKSWLARLFGSRKSS